MRTHLAVVAAVLIALAGCAAESPEEVDGTEAIEAPDGSRMIETDDGLSFAVPEEWSEISADSATGDGGAQFNKALELMGLTRAQFQALLAQVETFYIAPDSEDGFTPNLNIIHDDVSMPSDAGIRSQYAAIGATDIDVDDAESDLGDAKVTTYQLDVGGPTPVYGGAVAFEHDDGYAVITVSSTSEDYSEEIVELVLETLHETD